MKGAAKTRTQRRLEKRQAVILLVLVLAVSLASFTLGVIVGRRGAERDFAAKLKQTEKVLVAQVPAPAASTRPVPIEENPVANDAISDMTAQAEENAADETKLSFYDDLSKDTAPLGSGINLAPQEETTPAPAVAPPLDLPDQPIVKKQTETVVAKTEPVKPATPPEKPAAALLMPKVVAKGSHAVQIGSFNSAKDALALKDAMLNKNYPAFMVEADLGEKGLWYRVRIGPYADAASAKIAQQLLEEREQVKGFVSRQ